MLRVAELLVFGAPAAYFLVKQYHEASTAANLTDGHAFLPAVMVPWMLLIFTYALFIPNTWQRALAVLAVMGSLPVGLLWLSQPERARLRRFAAVYLLRRLCERRK